MRKFTIPKPVSLTVVPAYNMPVAAQTRTLSGLDFAQVQWIINPKAQTVSARAPGWPQVLIMGGASKTPYPATWTQQAFEDALIAQIGFPVATATLVAPAVTTPAAAPATPSATTLQPS